MAEKKIFISYNRLNEDIIKTIADDIEALGYTVWFDQELTGGQAWWERILAEVRDCDIFVFTLSPSALNSAACKLEYIYAGDLGKPILPILVGEGVSTNLMPPELSKIQFIDYRKKDRDSAFRLARALNAIPPPKPLPNPLPPAPEVPISYLGKLSARLEIGSNLSYEEQSALLIDLKRYLRDQESAGDTKILLKSFRNRRDLYASIAEEIDELINTLDKTQAVNNHTPSSPKKLPAIKVITPSSPKKLSAIKIINLSLLVAFGFLVGDLLTTTTYILAQNNANEIIYDIISPLVRGLPIGLCISLIVRTNIVYLPSKHFWFLTFTWIGGFYLQRFAYIFGVSYLLVGLLGYTFSAFCTAKIIQIQPSKFQLKNLHLFLITAGWVIVQYVNIIFNLRLTDYFSFNNFVLGFFGSASMFFILENSKQD